MSAEPLPADKAARLEDLRDKLAQVSAEGQFDRVHEEAKAQVRHRALLLLDQRARSRHELHDRLTQLEFEPQLITEVLDDLERCRLIDDEAFAREWVRQRHQIRGKSRRALRQELRNKGVGAEICEAALEQISGVDEADIARQLAVKKAATIRHEPADRKEYDKFLRRIVGMLARRGYGEGVSFSVAKQALDDRIAELTEQ